MKMKGAIVVPFLVLFVDFAWAQLSLPEMPGPPYPDKFGNNRWGVKYDPRIHGRGRNQFSSPSTSGSWDGRAPEYSPSVRYRDGGNGPPPSSTRSKWAAALKPLVSRTRLSKHKNSKRNRRPSGRESSSFDATSDGFYRNPYSSKSIDGYVKNYLNTYNKVSRIPPASSSDLVNIQNFARPTRYGSFRRNSNRRSFTSESSSLSDSYLRAAGLSDNKASYRTFKPQDGFFGPKINKKSDFAKTLSNVYNDYKPGGENSGFSIGSGNSAIVSSSGSPSVGSSISVDAGRTGTVSNSLFPDDDFPTSSFSIRPPPPPPPPGRTVQSFSSSSGPTYVERPFGKGKRLRRPPPPPPPPPPSRYTSGPLSSLDLYDDSPSYSYKSPSSSGPYDFELSDSPMVITSGSDSSSSSSPFGSGSFSSSGPVTVKSYTMSGPPPSSPYSSSFDTVGLSGSAPLSYNSIGGPPPYPPPPPPPAHLSSPYPPPPPPPAHLSSPYAPPYDIPPAGPPFGPGPDAPAPPMTPYNYAPPSGLPYPHPHAALYPHLNDLHNSKRYKNRLQHTPMNLIRGLLGRDRRSRYRDEDDRDTYKPAYAAHYPLVVPAPMTPIAPPQYILSPLINTVSGQQDYAQPLYTGRRPPPQRPQLSPLAESISSLRDTISVLRDTSPRQHQAPRQQGGYNGDNDNSQKENAPPKLPVQHGPITQHLNDWPRIFTAMGSSVDAVAGGIHAVRKEISKMTGQTVAKGLLMSGSAVHEVSKGMAHVITKMATI